MVAGADAVPVGGALAGDGDLAADDTAGLGLGLGSGLFGGEARGLGGEGGDLSLGGKGGDLSLGGEGGDLSLGGEGGDLTGFDGGDDGDD